MTITTYVEEFNDPSELPEDEQRLLLEAVLARSNAYAPYSRFLVGAALSLHDGTIIHGNNQENMAYPSGLCAERVAFFAAGAQYPGKRIMKVAITAAPENQPSDRPIAPCGACRQAMLEYEMNQGEDILLLMRGSSGKIFRMRGIHQLLPLFFHEPVLKEPKGRLPK